MQKFINRRQDYKKNTKSNKKIKPSNTIKVYFIEQ